MKSIKKFDDKKIKGFNENKLKGGIYHTGKWGRWDSDIAWGDVRENTYRDINIHIGPNRP